MLQNTIINSALLKEFSIYPLNYDTKELQNYVKLAEVQWILPVIGEDFYNELLEQVANDELTEENGTALVEAIYPYLGFAVAWEALPMTWAHVSEVGVTLGKSENSEPLTLKDLTLVQQHIRSQLEARKDYCIKWLCERQESFPLITTCECDCNTCCNKDKGKLNAPNKLQQIYTTPRKNTDIR